MGEMAQSEARGVAGSGPLPSPACDAKRRPLAIDNHEEGADLGNDDLETNCCDRACRAGVGEQNRWGFKQRKIPDPRRTPPYAPSPPKSRDSLTSH